MPKCGLNYNDFFNELGCMPWGSKSCCSCPCQPRPPMPSSCCCIGPQGPSGKSAYQIALENGFVGTITEWLASLKGEKGPFLSSYIEAVGSAQSIATRGNVVFSADDEDLDIAGTGIVLDASGTTFTITRPGLYHVEWSLNLSAGANFPIVIGLLEKGNATSALASATSQGSFSSGALINVKSSDLPFTISLHNFGTAITIADAENFANIAASIRILRFADGANA